MWWFFRLWFILLAHLWLLIPFSTSTSLDCPYTVGSNSQIYSVGTKFWSSVSLNRLPLSIFTSQGWVILHSLELRFMFLAGRRGTWHGLLLLELMHPWNGLTCLFWDVFLFIMVMQSVYLSHCSISVRSLQSDHPPLIALIHKMFVCRPSTCSQGVLSLLHHSEVLESWRSDCLPADVWFTEALELYLNKDQSVFLL